MDNLPVKGNNPYFQKFQGFLNAVALKQEATRLQAELKALKREQAAERKDWNQQKEAMGKTILLLAEGKLDVKDIDMGAFL